MNAEEGKEAIDYYLEVTPNSKNTTFSKGQVEIYVKKKEGTTITNISGA
jgi:predicted 3-demethylubiquinone-9 3-methyltransferase (glyoxalase superfamily)